MKSRYLGVFIILFFITSLVGSALAQVGESVTEHPLARREGVRFNQSADQRISQSASQQASDAAAVQVSLGAPGTSYRYVDTIGVNGEPYPADESHLYNPDGIFIDDTDNIYVVERIGHRMLKYNASFVHQLTIGHAGQQWHHDDFLSFPTDVAVSSDDHIWIVISTAIKEFDETGQLVQIFPENDPWISGSENDRFDELHGIAFDASGRLYVSDRFNHRVQVYEISGGTPVYSTTIGITGEVRSDNTGFNNPRRIAFDGSGRLYVMDAGNHRVQRCTYATTWSCVTFFGVSGVPGDDLTHLDLAHGVHIDGSDVYLADSRNQRVLKCDLNGVCAHFAGVLDEPGSDNAHLNFPTDVFADSSGNIFIADRGNFRIQKFNSSGTYLDTLGVTGVPYLTDNQRMNSPWGVAVAPDGGLYVTERDGLRLLKYNTSGLIQWSVGEPAVTGADNDHFGDYWAGLEGNPAVDASGKVYVTDTANHRVQIFNPNGTYFGTMGETRVAGNDNAHFACPAGAAVSPVDGDIFIVDHCNHRVQVFYSNLNYKTTIGVTSVAGDSNLQFNNPWGVAIDASGNIFVADADNFRVQKCNLVGLNYACSTFAGVTGVESRSFDHVVPISVAVDRYGRVFVADDWYDRVQVFSPTGEYLTTIGGAWGGSNGQFSGPMGVAVDPNGVVYASDIDFHRIQVFSPGYPGWAQVNLNGFGSPYGDWVTDLQEFQGDLYAGLEVYNEDGSYTSQLWKTGNGTDWSQVSILGVDMTSQSISSLETFGGMLYAGTYAEGGGRIMRSSDGTNWSFVGTPGLGSVDNIEVHNFAVFGGDLYTGLLDNSNGVSIYRSSDGSSWSNVVSNNFGLGNSAWVTFFVYGGELYAGLSDASKALLFRTSNGTSWNPVTTDGFGESDNVTIHGFAEFGGYLYASVRDLDNGAEIWRSASGNPGTWSKVVNTGFGNPANQRGMGLLVYAEQLYFAITNTQEGDQVWRMSDGANWEPVASGGWGDANNIFSAYDNKGFVVYEDSLFISTVNSANGGEIWQLLNPIYLPLLERYTPPPP